jgi:predicted  nucleic acid-binding Zn-ribbon protein
MDFMRKYHNDLLLEKQSKVLKAEQTKIRYLIEKKRQLRKEYLEKTSTSVSNTKEQISLEEEQTSLEEEQTSLEKEQTSLEEEQTSLEEEQTSLEEVCKTEDNLEDKITKELFIHDSILESSENSSILNKSTTVGKKNIVIKGNILKKGLVL